MVILAALFLLIGLSEGTSDDQVVLAEEVLASIKAGKPVDFDGCIIEGDLNLKSFEITGPVHFNHTTFRNRANFGQATFKDDAYFMKAGFNGYAYFEGADFNGTAYFGGTRFNGTANFQGADFNDEVDFPDADFNGDAHFGGVGFNGDANFLDAGFNGFADFNGAGFNGDAVFWRAGFNGEAYFGGAGFNGTAIFGYAEFNGTAYFWGARFNITDFIATQFNKEAHFENADFKSELSLTRTRYNRLYIRWYNITGGLVYDDAAYMSLMKNFKDLGYYEDYDSCYFQYRKAHRDQPWPAVGSLEQFIRKTFIDYPLEWFYGYGTKPFNAFLFSLAIVLVFAFFWWSIGLGGPKDKTRESLTDKTQESLKNKTDESLKDDEDWLDGGVTDIMTFSATVFLSGTRLFIDPPPLPRIEGRSRSTIKKAFILERVLGALFSVLFFIAISGTIARAS